MKTVKLGLIALIGLPFGANALSIGGTTNEETSIWSRANFTSYSAQSTIALPACSINYDSLGVESIQRVGFYVTEDVLDYATKEEVVNWINEQLDYSNQGLRNSCVEFQQEVAVVRFVETPDNQPDYSGSRVFSTEDLDVELYQSLIASLDVDDDRGVGTTPMGRTTEIIKSDWNERAFDRVVSVRPYYKPNATYGALCGVAYGNWSRPNKSEQTYMDAPENFWGESKPSSDAFATVVYPNDKICSSNDVIAHELGHTNGLSHERTAVPAPANNHEDTLGFASSCNGERSIMWSGTKNYRSVPFFSSPDITAGGIPCGDTLTSYGNDSVETLKFQLGTSIKHAAPRTTPYQGVVDAGNGVAVGDTSTWNTITSNRFGNMNQVGTVNFGTVPAIIDEINSTISVQVVRDDGSNAGSVLVRVYGDGNVVGDADIDYEKSVSFLAGETTKSVQFSTYASGFARQDGRMTFKLESPVDMNLGLNSEVDAYFDSAIDGSAGRVSAKTATYQCSSDVCFGTVNLARSGGTDGAIDIDVVYRLNGEEVHRERVTFYDGQTDLTSSVTDQDVHAMTVDLESTHPSLVQFSRASFADDSVNVDVPDEVGGSSGGGGGSIGYLGLILLALLGVRRKQ